MICVKQKKHLFLFHTHKKMRVVFRVDSSSNIGSGHVVRCTTLAKQLRDRGLDCQFVCRELAGNLIESIRGQGFSVRALQQTHNVVMDTQADLHAPDHAAWLGTDWHTDADQTIAALSGDKLDWLVVDHYALDALWEAALRPHATKIMVIDDLADRNHECDLLLDSSLVPDMEQHYVGLVPARCAVLVGPSWALLQPEYGDLHPRTPPRLGPVQRILISFGGVDQHNITGMAVAAVLEMQRDDIAVDVVLSSRSPHAATVRAQVERHANITVHDYVPCLAPLMLKADLALGAGGMTSWERCCLGLPALVVTVADNQRFIAGELERQGVVQWLGKVGGVTQRHLEHALQAIVDAPCALEPWSRRCMDMLDGQGTHRVASILMLDRRTPLSARPACARDEALLLRWSNDRLMRQMAFNSNTIPADDHRCWFYSRLRNDQCKIYILETKDKLSVGVVRFEHADDGWEIALSIDAAVRGRGLGSLVLEAAMGRLRVELPHASLFARVKHENVQSQALFERAGFAREAGGGFLVYRRAL